VQHTLEEIEIDKSTGKVAVVTGALKGISLAKEFAEVGAAAALNYSVDRERTEPNAKTQSHASRGCR